MTDVKNRARAIPLLLALAIGCTTAKPAVFGVLDGRLSPCPSAPHCASTQAPESRRNVEAARYTTTRDEARQRLISILRSMPRVEIVTEAPDYVHAQFTSRVFHYLDDVEIYLDDRAKLVHFRSVSQSGYYDLGVNRRRVAGIRGKFLAEK